MDAISAQLTFLSPSRAKLVVKSASGLLTTVPSLLMLPGDFSSNGVNGSKISPNASSISCVPFSRSISGVSSGIIMSANSTESLILNARSRIRLSFESSVLTVCLKGIGDIISSPFSLTLRYISNISLRND